MPTLGRGPRAAYHARMNKLRLSQRMRDLTQSDIRRLTLECERVGGVNLGQSICDLPTIPELKPGLARAVEENRSTYSRYDGVGELRTAVADRLSRKNGVAYDPEGEIVVAEDLYTTSVGTN